MLFHESFSSNINAYRKKRQTIHYTLNTSMYRCLKDLHSWLSLGSSLEDSRGHMTQGVEVLNLKLTQDSGISDV